MFKIDTGNASKIEGWDGPSFGMGSDAGDEGLRIDLSDWTRADRFKRQTLAGIWEQETTDDLAAFMDCRSVMMDALFLAHPDMADEITEQEQDCRVQMQAAQTNSAKADPHRAAPGNSLGISF